MAEVLGIGIALFAILAASVGHALWTAHRRRAREALRRRFGPEYDRAVEDSGSGEAARRELRARVRRVAKLPLRDLSGAEREGFERARRRIEVAFAGDPARALADLERLVEEVMLARGYPRASLAQRLADLSVHHARAVDDYRAAHAILRDGRASPEALRHALSRYRAVVAELVTRPLAHPAIPTVPEPLHA
ncbi:MAG: hypothetical protein M5U28_10830 [Sandaracinaceae bacterium]|nr:hypothetical protein [Sandaracinaceae bacterium]